MGPGNPRIQVGRLGLPNRGRSVQKQSPQHANGLRAGLGCGGRGWGREQFCGKTRLSRNFISQVSEFKLKIGLGVAGPPGDVRQAASVHRGGRSSEDVAASISLQSLERIRSQRGLMFKIQPLPLSTLLLLWGWVRSRAQGGREG